MDLLIGENLVTKIKHKENYPYDFNGLKISIIGLGYVGLPLAVEFSKIFNVVGYDNNPQRIRELKKGFDKTNEVLNKELLEKTNLKLTYKKDQIAQSDVFIITVPTPVNSNKDPDLNPLKNASKIVGSQLVKGNIVIYESTVFPGCTEEICAPILAKESNLEYNKDFFCGYSPERINPGDKEHTLKKIIKITSGSTEVVAEFIDQLYKKIIKAGTVKVSSISIAEAAKVIENTQRDVNIALVNELSILFNKLKIDTKEVLDAAKTKWNFLPFSPGLVGGHCIGVDPYYLTYKAKEVGYNPEIILAGRKINDKMGSYIAEKTISELLKNGLPSFESNIAILGLTFKENCPDLRNTKVVSILKHLESFQSKIQVLDPQANNEDALKLYGIHLKKIEDIKNQDAVIVAVGHNEYKSLKNSDIIKMLKPNGVLIDVKSIYNIEMFLQTNISYWRL